MLEINEFLIERIAEDEARANEALANPAEVYGAQGFFDPARVLDESLAKRAVVWIHHMDSEWNRVCNSCANPGSVPETVPFPCETLKALSNVYKDHPDYKPEWEYGVS